MLGKLPIPGRPPNLDHSRARASSLTVGTGGMVWTFFHSSIISLLSPSPRETHRHRLKYCFNGLLNPNNQLTNQIEGQSLIEGRFPHRGPKL